jgi:hypothetical protein
MISAYGPQATRFAARLGDLDAVITDVGTIATAYAEAVRRREIGAPFYGLVCLDDPRAAFGFAIGDQVLAQVTDDASRRIVLARLAAGTLPVNGVPAAEAWRPNPDVEALVCEFLALCDAVLVRSFAEARRVLRAFAGAFPPHPSPSTERVLAASTVPRVPRAGGDAVVLWAPERSEAACALPRYGLASAGSEVRCLSAGTSLPAAEEALARAAVIVCADASDPSDAVAFARLGYGVIAPITSGAHEFAAGVIPWDVLDALALPAAVAFARTHPASVRAEPPAPLPAPLRPPCPPFFTAATLPLVTILTPTYNRPDELRGMLESIAKQTYPNIEALVVNDGGTPVGDVVAAFPFARLIDQPRNFGALRAVERGIAEARGAYIGLLPDDDRLYPDHVERIMYAMLRSGATIGHGAGFLRFLERDETGNWRTIGYNNRTFSQTCTPTEALICATLGGHQFIAHRSAYDTCGGYLLDSDISDNEIHARFTQRYFYAFVDHVTSEFRDHAGGQGRQCDFPAALRDMYENHHPLKDRPEIERQRLATIENIRQREPGKPPFPMTIKVGVPAGAPP